MHDRRLFDVPEIVKPSGAPDGARAILKVSWFPDTGWVVSWETQSWRVSPARWEKLDLGAQPCGEFADVAPALSTRLRVLRELIPPF
jgi:hypothetical protein